jgi:TctA family transporter
MLWYQIPMTFSVSLDVTSSMVLLTSIYYGAIYGGWISSILLNIPGEEPATMTTLDGYPMAKAGLKKRRLCDAPGRHHVDERPKDHDGPENAVRDTHY